MLSYKQCHKLLKKLRLQDGDILLIQKESELGESAKMIGDALAARGFNNVLVMLVSDLNDVRKMPPEEMHRHGWYRPRDYKKMLGDLAERESQVEQTKSDKESGTSHQG